MVEVVSYDILPPKYVPCNQFNSAKLQPYEDLLHQKTEK